MSEIRGEQENPVTYAGCTVPTFDPEHAVKQTAVSTKDSLQIINDTEFTYSEGWTPYRLTPRWLGYFNNTNTSSSSAGAWAEYLFSNCESIVLYCAVGKEHGKGLVYLDGGAPVEIDTYREDEIGVRKLFDSGLLPEGEHKIRIEVAESEGKTLELDHLEAAGIPAPIRIINNGNSAFFHSTTGFHREENADSYSGRLLTASDSEEEVSFYFKGSYVRLYGEKAPENGKFEILLDGESKGTIDCQGSSRQISTLLFEVEGLAEDMFHELRLITPDEHRVAIDYAEIPYNESLMTVMNRRTDQELARMERHETTATEPKDWKPITLSGKVPEHEVDLHGGVFRQAFQRNIQYLKDSLKKPCWVDNKDQDRIWVDMLSASNEGRMLGGIGNTLRFAEDEELRQAAEEIIDVIERRQFMNGNGYMMPYDSNHYKLWQVGWPEIMMDEEKNYDRAMLTKGMLAAGQGGLTQVYPILRKFYDWYNNAKEYLPYMLLGSMGVQGSIAGPLVYHSPAGIPEDIMTNMKYYDMDWWLEYLAQGLPESIWRFTLNRPHNYLLTSICAYFEEYTATGEQKYLDACLGAWNIYHQFFHLPGGGISICEHFECPPKSHFLTNLPNNIYETCGGVFWIDLNHRFLQLWPERELYAAQMEQSIYNIVLASQGEDGCIRYFNHMNGRKDIPGRYNTCCEIQATAFFGKLPQYIYMLADDGVYVNLFAGSDIRFEVDGRPYGIHMNTKFPYTKEVSLHLSAPAGGNMKVRLRIPSWTTGPVEVCINGIVAAAGKPGEYITLEQEWQDGDRIEFSLPMTFKAERYIGRDRVDGCERYAFSYGPLLMAVRGPLSDNCLQAKDEPTIRLSLSAEELLAGLTETDKPLEFSIANEETYRLVPYFSIKDESFTCFPALNQ